MSRNVIDAALVMTGYDRRDPGCADVAVSDMAAGIEAGVAGERIGIPANYYTDQVDSTAAAAAGHAAGVLKGLGAELVEVSIPMAEHIIATEWAIMMPEAASAITTDCAARRRTPPTRYARCWRPAR